MESKNFNSLYDKYYYDHCCGATYVRNDHWMSFFGSIAKSIKQEINPSTVLDAGCAKGFLVEALRSLDIQTWGIDISEFAIDNVHESIQPYCFVQSLTTDLEQDYSLITCIEVLEHMPEQDAKVAIQNMCSHSQDILFSSSPNDYKEATHINVHPPEYWVEQFARYSFFRDLDFDASFLTPWAVRFRHSDDPSHRVLGQYERKLWLLIRENTDLRESTLQLQHQVSYYKSQLEQTQTQLEQTHATIQGMESSKFWKTRNLWFSAKKLFKLSEISSLRFRSHLYNPSNDLYHIWTEKSEPTIHEVKRQRIDEDKFAYRPLISIVLPVYKISTQILFETLQSISNQSYTNWEVCIALADLENQKNSNLIKEFSNKDKRFKVNILPENLGISGNSNQSLKLSQGEFIALLDHDDILAPFALFECVKKLNSQPDLDFLYSDKDCINEDGNIRSRLLLKPQWSPEILYSANYLTHLCIIRRKLVNDLGGFKSDTDGAQDWDLFLRVSEVTTKIARIEGVLYHWRIIEGSTSLGIESKPYASDGQLQTIRQHLLRKNLSAHAIPHPKSGFHIKWSNTSSKSLILLDGNVTFDELSACLAKLSITLEANLHQVKVLLSNNNFNLHRNAIDKLTKALTFSIDWLSIEENKYEAINCIVNEARHDSILFLSGKVQDFHDNWLGELTAWVTNNPSIGFASALVLTKNNIVVESGLVVDKFNNTYPLFYGEPIHNYGIFGGPLWYRNCSASSPWAVAFNIQDYRKVGGLDDKSSSFNHAIVQLCQAILKTGKRGMVNPHSQVFLENLPATHLPEFDNSLFQDPYFHPQLNPVFPLSLKIK